MTKSPSKPTDGNDAVDLAYRRRLVREETVCPVCFAIYPAGKTNFEFPTCPDCYSEAIEVDVELLADFLSRMTLKDLQQIDVEWRNQKGFLEAYKQLKQGRIDDLIRRKLARGLPSA